MKPPRETPSNRKPPQSPPGHMKEDRLKPLKIPTYPSLQGPPGAPRRDRSREGDDGCTSYSWPWLAPERSGRTGIQSAQYPVERASNMMGKWLFLWPALSLS